MSILSGHHLLRRGSVAAALLAAALVGTPAGHAQAGSAAKPGQAAATCADHQLEMAYFRTWRDKASDPTVNQTTMGDLPPEVDAAFVFGDQAAPQAFWDALASTYVPKLHAQGTKVLLTLNVNELIDTTYSNDAAGYQALADHLIATWITPYNLDGFDVDVERSLSGTDLQRATGVFNALSTHFGPASGNASTMLIYDTNLDGTNALFRNVYSKVSQVLEQSYGRSVSSLSSTWSTFSRYIQACQYLVGFSFYEENGTNWGDVNPPMETSRAWQYADWQPSGATKGGIFSYAVDRDGVVPGDNAIEPTDYSWTIALKHEMNP